MNGCLYKKIAGSGRCSGKAPFKLGPPDNSGAIEPLNQLSPLKHCGLQNVRTVCAAVLTLHASKMASRKQEYIRPRQWVQNCLLIKNGVNFLLRLY
jgi:hypothetical protein